MESIRNWFQRGEAYRLLFIAIALGTLFYVFTSEDRKDQAWYTWSMPLSGMIIVIDPGHGGYDGGAVSKNGGLVEKEITLRIAYYLRDYLQESGALVILTREDDSDLAGTKSGDRKAADLQKRVELINKSSADAVISIHLNSFPSSKWRGAQTFYNPVRDGNQQLARLIQDELIINLENTNRKALMNQELFLLRNIEPVGALVEVGFLSNSDEASLLSTPVYQQQVAASIYRGILRYFAGDKISNEKK